MRTYDERSAEELLRRGLAELELTVDEVRELNNVDLRKQALAWMVKTRSVVTHVWVSKRLEMAHRINVTRALQRTCDACVVNSRGWCTKRHGVRRIRVRARAPCYNADRYLSVHGWWGCKRAFTSAQCSVPTSMRGAKPRGV